MSAECVPVVKIDEVYDHPNADRLSIVKIGGYECISAKLEDGTPRYHKGDNVVYIPTGYIVPEWLLKKGGFWDYELNEGLLSGHNKDRVKAIRIRGVFSQGILLPLEEGCIRDEHGETHDVVQGSNVMGILGITKYYPPIPTAMRGLVKGCTEIKPFDVESIEKFPYLFENGEKVWVSEKIHGTCSIIGWNRKLNDPEFIDGKIYTASKGMARTELVFKHNSDGTDCNQSNLYQATLRSLVNKGLSDWLGSLASQFQAEKVHLYGEIYGRCVQDLHYGEQAPSYRVFDIAADNRFVNYDEFKHVLSAAPFLVPVPCLYEGPFDMAVIKSYRDGMTQVGGNNIREGIVIRSCDRSKIAKWVSPQYLLRKNKDATEYE